MSARQLPIRSLLFVCLGNICRSPMAEGILRVRCDALGLSLHLDSAGTGGWHAGEAPDARARQVCRSHGAPIDELRARQVQARDFERFDLILAADRHNLSELERLRPRGARAELALLLDWAGQGEAAEVPDPYYGRLQAFEDVFELLDRACHGITARLRGVAECDEMLAGGTYESPW